MSSTKRIYPDYSRSLKRRRKLTEGELPREQSMDSYYLGVLKSSPSDREASQELAKLIKRDRSLIGSLISQAPKAVSAVIDADKGIYKALYMEWKRPINQTRWLRWASKEIDGGTRSPAPFRVMGILAMNFDALISPEHYARLIESIPRAFSKVVGKTAKNLAAYGWDKPAHARVAFSRSTTHNVREAMLNYIAMLCSDASSFKAALKTPEMTQFSYHHSADAVMSVEYGFQYFFTDESPYGGGEAISEDVSVEVTFMFTQDGGRLVAYSEELTGAGGLERELGDDLNAPWTSNRHLKGLGGRASKSFAKADIQTFLSESGIAQGMSELAQDLSEEIWAERQGDLEDLEDTYDSLR